MSQDTIQVNVAERQVVRKKLSALRSSGKIPAVIHNHGSNSIHVEADAGLMQKVIKQAGKHHPIELTVGSATHLALIRDIDMSPKKQEIRHVVFQAIRRDQKAQSEVPLRFSEDIPAEKAGLLVLRQVDTIEVEAMPKDLPDEIIVNADSLVEVGDSISVESITPPSGVTILTDPQLQLAIVEMPKDQIAAADAAAAEQAEADGKIAELADEAQEGSAEESPAKSS
jgi:large subunit ribosomal protein L25